MTCIVAILLLVLGVLLDKNLRPKYMRQKRSFLAKCPTLPRINGLPRTKTPGKTFAVLAGF